MPSPGDSGGFLLSLVTESFAVRALLGSLAAALLAAFLVGSGAVQTRRARRAVLLTPVLSAAIAAVASIGEVYLPQLWVATPSTTSAGTWLDLFGEQRGLVTDHGLDVLVITYGVVAAVLLARRVCGFLAVKRALRKAVAVPAHDPLAVQSDRLARIMQVRPPRLVLLARCPGGAFTSGARRPVVAVDPELLHTLDEQELEGLLAHELAHIARQDTLLGTVVGLFRDVSFFLPPLHVAVRWLRREQEEGADELASHHTGRPVALASSILKVWDCSRSRRQLAGACAAVAALPSGVLVHRPMQRGAVKFIAARVERLISRAPAPSKLRQRGELGLASIVLAAGATAALTVPTWIATDLNGDVTFLFLPAAPTAPAEAPAFETFRALTASVDEDVTPRAAAVRRWPSAGTARGCPCVESQGQLARGEPAVGLSQPSRLAWGSQELPPWAMVNRYDDAVVRTARPVLAFTDSGPQVGLFLVSRPKT